MAKLKTCDWLLLIITVLVLGSSIQLEATGSSSSLWVWLHIGVCGAFMGLICWHVYLHFRWKNWGKRLLGRRGVMRWLSIFGILVLLTAIIATVRWCATSVHSGIGGVHGKIGFVFLVFVIIHIVRHLKFYKRRKAPARKSV